MSSRSPRDLLTPQMHEYDRVGVSFHPYIMFFQEKSYKSDVVNTDSNGFRFTNFNEKKFASDSLACVDEVSLVIGGSTAFGVGATSDRQTISSILSQKTNILHLNLGGRAFNSTQELILFKWLISQKPKIKDVTIVSGANDLYLSTIKTNSFMPGQFFGMQYEASMTKGMLSPKRKLLKLLLSKWAPNDINWTNMDIKTIITSSLKSMIDSSTNRTLPRPNSYSERIFSVKSATSYLDSSLCFWSALSTFLDFRLTYVLQPFASWCKKQYTHEEKSLFAYLNASEQDPGGVLKQMLDIENYSEFTQGISLICDKYKINYLDSNAILAGRAESSNEWLYVDRIHLTDLGYKVLANIIHHHSRSS